MINKMTRFNSKNITRFLRAYTYKMEIYQVLEEKIVETFAPTFVQKIKERVKQLHRKIYVNTWTIFKKRLNDEYFNEDIDKMSKKGFLTKQKNNLINTWIQMSC